VWINLGIMLSGVWVCDNRGVVLSSFPGCALCDASTQPVLVVKVQCTKNKFKKVSSRLCYRKITVVNPVTEVKSRRMVHCLIVFSFSYTRWLDQGSSLVVIHRWFSRAFSWSCQASQKCLYVSDCCLFR
jgi:hypothetical protein